MRKKKQNWRVGLLVGGRLFFIVMRGGEEEKAAPLKIRATYKKGGQGIF